MVRAIDLSFNLLTGGFPGWVENLRSLAYVALSMLLFIFASTAVAVTGLRHQSASENMFFMHFVV